MTWVSFSLFPFFLCPETPTVIILIPFLWDHSLSSQRMHESPACRLYAWYLGSGERSTRLRASGLEVNVHSQNIILPPICPLPTPTLAPLSSVLQQETPYLSGEGWLLLAAPALGSNFSLNRISSRPLLFHLLLTPASHSSQFLPHGFCTLWGPSVIRRLCSSPSSVLHPTKTDDLPYLLWSIFQFSQSLFCLCILFFFSVTLILLHFQKRAEAPMCVEFSLSRWKVIPCHLFSIEVSALRPGSNPWLLICFPCGLCFFRGERSPCLP